MKLWFALLTLVISTQASADCISKSEAQTIAIQFFITEGAFDFPGAFKGKTPDQIKRTAETLAQAIETIAFNGMNLGYSTLVYAEEDLFHHREEYLNIDCSGKVGVQVINYEN